MDDEMGIIDNSVLIVLTTYTIPIITYVKAKLGIY